MTLLVLIFWFGVSTSFNCSKRDFTTEIKPLEMDINVSDQTDDSSYTNICL